ncbi:MAG TPA: helix-turn-helix domain-containing protein, partial [Acidimicrobiales bacterium]|nr:helix-turn-helix domain-containing protein [Acidimicrobiales bacterium]
MRRSVSGVGVLDKAVSLLDSLENGPLALNELADVSGVPRATAHRLALALEVHGMIGRDDEGRFILGARLAARSLDMVATPALERL